MLILIAFGIVIGLLVLAVSVGLGFLIGWAISEWF